MRSKKYATIKGYYEKGLWNAARVKNAVVKGWITEEECHMILNDEEEEAE